MEVSQKQRSLVEGNAKAFSKIYKPSPGKRAGKRVGVTQFWVGAGRVCNGDPPAGTALYSDIEITGD